MRKNKGFTLIELLVVIAIIGILSAVVLASLNTARNKGKDASAKASISSVRAQAEIFYNTGTGLTYDGVCAATDVARLLTAADNQAGDDTCNDEAGAYAAEIVLNDATRFCVDSTGFAGASTAALGTATACAQ
jgi:prepilin-type N-terminal cleavage/methylation domain-containing protein